MWFGHDIQSSLPFRYASMNLTQFSRTRPDFFFSNFIFTTAQVVFTTAMITCIFTISICRCLATLEIFSAIQYYRLPALFSRKWLRLFLVIYLFSSIVESFKAFSVRRKWITANHKLRSIPLNSRYNLVTSIYVLNALAEKKNAVFCDGRINHRENRSLLGGWFLLYIFFKISSLIAFLSTEETFHSGSANFLGKVLFSYKGSRLEYLFLVEVFFTDWNHIQNIRFPICHGQLVI